MSRREGVSIVILAMLATGTDALPSGHIEPCEECDTLGHVKAHPELGCADVGCNNSHDQERS
jgi:hypothetical protein